MKVMVIVKASKSSEAGDMPSTELLSAMGQYNEELVKAGIMLAGEGLRPSSQGARVHFSGETRTVTDGPFTETKELIAGYWMWKVNSLAEAIEWVKKCPNPMTDDSDIEIRPVFEADDFGEEFTPELREQEAAIRAQSLGLNAPRFEQGSERTVVGFAEHYTSESRSEIPQLWERFISQAENVPHRVGEDFFGVSWNQSPDCSFDYLSGVGVDHEKDLPDEFKSVQLTAGRYVVFSHSGHVSELEKTFDKIWSEWIPDCGLQVASSAPCYERYTSDFDAKTGMGGMEIWIPLKD